MNHESKSKEMNIWKSSEVNNDLKYNKCLREDKIWKWNLEDSPATFDYADLLSGLILLIIFHCLSLDSIIKS